jgi:hypothetical protein
MLAWFLYVLTFTNKNISVILFNSKRYGYLPFACKGGDAYERLRNVVNCIGDNYVNTQYNILLFKYYFKAEK